MPKKDLRNVAKNQDPLANPVYIYLAGPLTTGNVLRNIHTAFIEMGRMLDAGYAVYLPHVSAFSEVIYDHEISYDEWMCHDYRWLNRCDILVRLPGASHGAELEIKFAKKHHIPVYYKDEFWRAHGSGFKFKPRYK